MKAKLFFHKVIPNGVRANIKRNDEKKQYSCSVSFEGEILPNKTKIVNIEMLIFKGFKPTEEDVLILTDGNNELAVGYIQPEIGEDKINELFCEAVKKFGSTLDNLGNS